MSSRSHTRKLGCISCSELEDLGAGKEGWLVDNPNLRCALDTHSLALANKYLVVITGWDGGPRFKIRPELSPIESEHITALEWLAFDDIRSIAVGTFLRVLVVLPGVIARFDGIVIQVFSGGEDQSKKVMRAVAVVDKEEKGRGRREWKSGFRFDLVRFGLI